MWRDNEWTCVDACIDNPLSMGGWMPAWPAMAGEGMHEVCVDECRQDGGTVDLADVAQHEAALQDSITLANQAASGDRFTKTQLEQAATPLQVPPLLPPSPRTPASLRTVQNHWLTCWHAQCAYQLSKPWASSLHTVGLRFCTSR